MAEHDQAVGDCAARMIAALRAHEELPAGSVAELDEITIRREADGDHITALWREVRGDGTCGRRRSSWVRAHSARDRSQGSA